MKRNLARLPALATLVITSVFAVGPAADFAPYANKSPPLAT